MALIMLKLLVYAVDHYSLLRYVPSFDFPLKRNRSQISLFLSAKGGLVSPCHVDLKPMGVWVVHKIGVDKSKLGIFIWFLFFTFRHFHSNELFGERLA